MSISILRVKEILCQVFSDNSGPDQLRGRLVYRDCPSLPSVIKSADAADQPRSVAILAQAKFLVLRLFVVMTKSPITVRVGATVTHVHDPLLAQKWVTHLMAATAVYDADKRKEQVPRVRSGNDFVAVHELQRGGHQYKLTVHDQDVHGNMNNVLDMSNCQRFEPTLHDKDTGAAKSGQVIPDPNDYMMDAPVIPVVVHKSTLKEEMALEDEGMVSPTPSSEATAKMIDKADVHKDICERLKAVEAALRLQLAAGTSHLQEIEMAPGAFGLSAAARPTIKAIRKRRNAALHVVDKYNIPRSDDLMVLDDAVSNTKGPDENNIPMVLTREMHHQRVDTYPGDSTGLSVSNTKGLDNAVSNTKGLDKNNRPTSDEADNEESDEETVYEIPKGEMLADPLYQVRVSRRGCNGSVELIETGSFTNERLYRVLYDDGDIEHVTAQEAARGYSEFLDALVLTWAE